MNKKGWLRVVEAFFSILLIAGALLIVINQGYIGNTDISEKVYNSQLSVLREIELDQDLRQAILAVSSLPVESLNSDGTKNNNFPTEVRTTIDERMPGYLQCQAVICDLEKICETTNYLADSPDKDVYAQSVAIAATNTNYDPRQLKLFCITK